MTPPREPVDVMPPPLGRAVADLPYWFVIGGQAMRCFCPLLIPPSRQLQIETRVIDVAGT